MTGGGEDDDTDNEWPTCEFDMCNNLAIGEFVIKSERGGEVKEWNKMVCESHLEAFRKGQFALQADEYEVITNLKGRLDLINRMVQEDDVKLNMLDHESSRLRSGTDDIQRRVEKYWTALKNGVYEREECAYCDDPVIVSALDGVGDEWKWSAETEYMHQRCFEEHVIEDS